jgi:Tfp pilus assembly protein PilO
MKTRFIEQLAESPQRVRFMFRIALITLLAAGCYNWMIKPRVSNLFAAEDRTQHDAMLLDQQKRMQLSINDLNKNIDDLKAQSEQFHKILFEPEMVREFFCGLEVLAEKSDCQIKSLTFSGVDNSLAQGQSGDAIVQTIQASVVAVGNYDAFVRFFKQTSQFPQKISIHELRFEPLAEGQSVLRCNAVITVYVANKPATIKKENNPEIIQ